MEKISWGVLLLFIMGLWPLSSNASQNMIHLNEFFGFSFNLGAELNYYQFDFSDELLTVNAHPADSPTGSTKVDFNEGWGINCRLKLRFYFDLPLPFTTQAGTDLGLNIMATDTYRSGLFETESCDYGGES